MNLYPVSFLVRELYDTVPAHKINADQLKRFYPTDELTTPHDPVDPDETYEDNDEPFRVAYCLHWVENVTTNLVANFSFIA